MKILKVKDVADQIIQGAKQKKPHVKIPFYRVKLVKERTIRAPISEITNQADLVHVATSELADVPHEELIAIGLDGRNHIIGVVRVSQGGLDSAAVTAKEVIRPLISMGAVGFVVAHNHPSGDPTPSRHDYTMTDALKVSSECVGLTMLDHIVIGGIRGGGHREIMNRYSTGTFVKKEPGQ